MSESKPAARNCGVQIARSARLLARWVEAVRALPDDLTYPNGLRLNVLPIIVVDVISLLGAPAPEDLTEIDLPWCYVQPPGRTLSDMTAFAVAQWRTQLLLELDYVGYAISRREDGRFEVSHVLRRPRRESRFFGPDATPEGLRRSRYLLLPGDLEVAFAPYVELQHLLNNLTAIAAEARKKPEMLLHEFFLRNPEMMYRGEYGGHWHEALLRHPDPMRRAIEPDFILQPPDTIPRTGTGTSCSSSSGPTIPPSCPED